MSRAIVRLRFFSILVPLAVILTAGCGGSGGNSNQTPPPPANNPVPDIASLSPSTLVVNSAAQTLTIVGTSFMSSSTVTFNGSARSVTFVSSTELTISLSASDLTTVGTDAVIVSNPTPGGGASNSVNFSVTLPAPLISSLSPISATAGDSSQTLTINGSNFVNGATATFNGTAHTVTFVSSTQLTITLTAADQATAGTFPVVVTNPDSQTANTSFTVNNAAPTITSLSPASTYPCDPVPTLTINGTNFVTGSTVTYNGNAKAVNLVSSTQLTIALTASDIGTPGSMSVVVTNPTPGGGSSPASPFTVNTPTGPTFSGTGPLGATLTVYKVNSDGSNGTLVCTSATDAQTGAFSVTIDSSLSGAGPFVSHPRSAAQAVGVVLSPAIRLITAGGQIPYSYANAGVMQTTSYAEASQDSALFVSTPLAGQSGIQIDMLSTFVDTRAYAELKHGQANTLSAAHSDATKLLDGYYGLSGATAIELIPSGTATADSTIRTLAEYAVLDEALSLQLTQPGDLRTSLATDISDGDWDGIAYGTAVALEGGNQPATAGTTDFLDTAVSWFNTSAVTVWGNGIASPMTHIIQGLTACSCTPFGIGLAPGNSGAIVPLAFGGHQYLFIAAGSKGMDVVDVSDPTATAPPIKAWPSISTTTFGGAPVSGLAVIVGNADHPEIFAFSGSDQNVALLNAVTLATGSPSTDDPQEFVKALGLVSQTQIQLSGAQWWVTGAFWDGCWEGCRVILSSADGYISFDPATQAKDESLHYPVDDPNETVTGNMGPDNFAGISVSSPTASTHRVILAANRGGMQLVDLSASASFYIPDGNPFWTTYLPSFPQSPSDDRYDDGDGNAMDPVYQVGILNAEGVNSILGLVNLNGITETVGATAAQNTFTPSGAVQVTLASSVNAFAVEGSSVDPTSHQALLEGPGSVITVAQIQNPSTVPAGGTWSGFSDWAFYGLSNSPSLNGFQNTDSDIHGVTTLTSLGMVKASTLNAAYGYILSNSNTVLLQVDLGAFLALTRQGSSGDAHHEPSGDPATATSAATGGAVVQVFVLQ